jgi:hypothetical protein
MPGRATILVAGWLVLAAAATGQPAISFEENAVVARGLPPGSRAVVFGIAREPQRFFTRVVRRNELLTADASGEVRLQIETGVPRSSVWFVADTSTGNFGTGSPEGSAAKEIPFPATAVRTGAAGRAGRLTSTLGFVEILYVRPGRGVWGLAVGHRGENDDPDTPDRSVAAALDRMYSVDGSPPPPSDFAAGDVVLVVDPRHLQFFAGQIGSR